LRAAHRRALGLPAISINWGVLAETGYVARHETVSKMLMSHGVNNFTPEWACHILATLLGGSMHSHHLLLKQRKGTSQHDIDEEGDGDTFEEGSEEMRSEKAVNANSGLRLAMIPVNLGVFQMDFSKFFEFCPSMRNMQRFAVFAAQAEAAKSSQQSSEPTSEGAPSVAHSLQPLRERLENASSLPAAAADLEKALAAQAGVVLGLGDTIDVAQPLTSLGFDSMMAIELKNWVDRQLRLDVPVIDFVRGPSCKKLALQLLDRMGLTAILKATAAPLPTPGSPSPTPSISPSVTPSAVTPSSGPIALVFAGQGGAGVNMGMDLYKSSPAAKAVWDEAENHFMTRFGISLLNIVQHNPNTLTISFDGEKGAALRANYISLTMNPEGGMSSGDGGEPDRVFPTITADTPSYTFTSPNGLLYATHFTQPLITVFEKAAFEHIVHEAGIDEETLRKRTIFAGHSLGEYCALLCGAHLASVSEIAELTFVRGLAMQDAVPRNEAGVSPYAMMAVSPKRAGALFHCPDPDALLMRICAAVRAAAENRLLEVVNLNVRGDQVVVAGERYCLWILSDVLDTLRLRSEGKAQGSSDVLADLEDVCAKSVAAHPSRDAPLTVPRSTATIQLPSIDVPFHSSLLRPTVQRFRSFLARYLPPHFDYASHLHGRYIPNVTGRLFEVTFVCCSAIRDATQSPILDSLVQQGAQEFDRRLSQEGPSSVARIMLQEALAYQLALPVQWVSCQDTIFHALSCRRVLEIGPSNTLQGMLQKTIAQKPLPKSSPPAEILSWSTDSANVIPIFK